MEIQEKKQSGASGYFYLFLVAMLFSFGGTCVKLMKPVMSPEYITFSRFAVGIFFLLCLKLIQRKKPQIKIWNRWVILGGISKALAYSFENYALSMGPSYGNIVTWPLQAVMTAVLAVCVLKEHLTKREVICMVVCVVSVLLICWNGRSLSEYFEQNAMITLFYVLTSLGAVLHVFSQKMLLKDMDIADSNLSIFLVSIVIAAIPMFVSGRYYGGFQGSTLFAMTLFGFVTGIGFYLNAKGMETAALHVVPIIQSTTTIFSLMWGVLFFSEKLSAITIVGSVIFLLGIIFMKQPKKAAE